MFGRNERQYEEIADAFRQFGSVPLGKAQLEQELNGVFPDP